MEKIEITKDDLIKLIHSATNNVKDFVMDNEGFINEQLKLCEVSISCAEKEEIAFGKGYNLGAKEAATDILNSI